MNYTLEGDATGTVCLTADKDRKEFNIDEGKSNADENENQGSNDVLE